MIRNLYKSVPCTLNHCTGYTLLLYILLTFAGPVEGCTVPVFRYALDRWSGKSDPSLELSDLYKEISDRILSGHSAVFIQIDSGNKEIDDQIYSRLENRLQFFETVAELPEIDPNDPASQLGPGPELKLKLSAIRISRDHPAVSELAGPEMASLPDDEAWVIPVFGRGRVLGAWPESMMDEEGIDEACHYLTGACSCQVKHQNPGWDLVMNVNWGERLMRAAVGEEPPPIRNEQSLTPEEVEISTIDTKTNSVNWITLIVGIVVLGGGCFLLFGRK